MQWTHRNICFSLSGVSTAQFYTQNSSQHPYTLADTDEDAPFYSVVAVPANFFKDDEYLQNAKTLIWYEQFAYVVKQYSMHIMQNVSLPDSLEF